MTYLSQNDLDFYNRQKTNPVENKQKLEHIRWRAIANPHALKEI